MRAILTVLLVLPLVRSLHATDAPPRTELHVQLRFVDGFVSIDRSAVAPSDPHLVNPTPAAEADLQRMLRSIDKRLREAGRACRWNEAVTAANLNTDAVKALTTPWREGKEQLQAWLQQQGTPELREQIEAYGTDVLGDMLIEGERRIFTEFPKETPLTVISNNASKVAQTGHLVFAVANPLESSELPNAVVAQNSGVEPVLVEELRERLRAQVGKLWWTADIASMATEFFWLRGIDPSTGFDISGYFLQAPADVKKLAIHGPARLQTLKLIGATHTDEDSKALLFGAYNLLPTAWYDALRRTAPDKTFGLAPVPDPARQDAVLVDLTRLGLERQFGAMPTFVSAGLAKSEARLAALGYAQTPAGDFTDLTIVFTPPAENRVREEARKAVDAAAPRAAAVRRHQLVLSAGSRPRTAYETAVRYLQTQIAGTDTFQAGAGLVETLAEGDISYSRDYIGFPEFPRRLTVTAQSGRAAATDREVASVRAEEKRDHVSATASIEVLRNPTGHSLSVDAEAGVLRTRLKPEGTPSPGLPPELTARMTSVSLRVQYALTGLGGGLPWVDLELQGGRANPNAPSGSGYTWGRLSASHRWVLLHALRWECRAFAHAAEQGAPLSEQPSFGGEESVRGFRRDAARGRTTWAVQNELWFRPPANLGLPDRFLTFARRSLAMAVFADAGGVANATEHRAPIAASAGVGLRLIQGPLTIRADFAHTVGRRGNVREGSAGYLTLTVRPQF